MSVASKKKDVGVHVSLFGVYSIELKTLLFFDAIHVHLAYFYAHVGTIIMEHANIVESTKGACHINKPPVWVDLPGWEIGLAAKIVLV